MPTDIFDQLDETSTESGDIFDQIEPSKDVFDEVASEVSSPPYFPSTAKIKAPSQPGDFISTTTGGPRKPLATYGETMSSVQGGSETPAMSLVAPRVSPYEGRIKLPQVPIAEDAGFIESAASEVVNQLEGVPEFFSSDAGILSLLAAKVSPRLVSAGFSADLTYTAYQQAKELYKNWDTMTPAQKGKGTIDALAALVFGASAGAHAAGVKIPSVNKPRPEFQGPLATGEILTPRKGAEPPKATARDLTDQQYFDKDVSQQAVEAPPVPATPPVAPARPIVPAEPVEPTVEPVVPKAVVPGEPSAAPVAPELLKGDRLVSIERTEPDGSKSLYVGAFNPDKFLELPDPATGGTRKVPVTHKASEGMWSTGMLGENERIIEDGGKSAAAWKPEPKPTETIPPATPTPAEPAPVPVVAAVEPVPPTPAVPPVAAEVVPVVPPVAPKRKYSGEAYRADKNEFERLVIENAEKFGWSKAPDLLQPGATGFTEMFYKMELKKAIKNALSDLGISADRFTEKFKAQTLPKLKAFLEERNKPDDPGAHAADVSTDFLPPEEASPAVPAPKVGKIDDWISKLESLKSKGGDAGLASFPDPEVFKGIGSALRNTAIDVAIGVLKAGKSIAEALDAAMAHIRERSKEFDEPKLRAALQAYLEPPDTTGIAHRVSESRGMAPERGKGIAPAESVEHGRELLQQGLDPKSVLDLFNKTKAVRADDMAVVRAHLEKLSKATNKAADIHGVDSPEYKAAWEAEKNWRAAVKPMQTEWHRVGMAQQGETDIDTGTFTGLQRAHEEKTGTEFNPGQKKRAQRIAKTNKDAQNQTAGARAKLNQHLRDKSTGDMTAAEKRAFDAANKTVREADIRAAQAENKARVDAAKRAKSITDIQVQRMQKIRDAMNKRATKAAADLAAKERKLQGDPMLRVWNKAKEYLDQGLDSFDDIRKKVATDLGMSIEQVTRLLQQDKRAKFLADDLWKKQQKERKLRSQSKRWVEGLSTPGYLKAIQSIPRIMFGLKVGFHGTVALGTHAPTVAFQPRFWKSYVRDFGKMYKMIGKPSYYENQVQDLMRRDNYITARRAGLVNDPFVYEDFNSPDTAKYFGALTGMGNRGYTVLKILRQDMFDQHWGNLPKNMQIPEVAQAIADGVNHATGVVKGRAPTGTNLMLFAPRLEASRAMWLAGDPAKAVGTLLNWKNASTGDKYFAMNQLKEKAWVVGTLGSLLALNQGFLSAVNSDQTINVDDPFKPDFLKFKVAGMNVSYGNPLITMARLPLRLFVGIENEGKLNKIVYEDENVATILFEYIRSQMSPFAGTATDLAIGRDFMRRPLPRAGFGLLPGKTNMPRRLREEGIKPYTWPEYTVQQLAMIPLQEALKEVWGKDLMMTPADQERSLKALATIIVMSGTGARISEDYSLRQRK